MLEFLLTLFSLMSGSAAYLQKPGPKPLPAPLPPKPGED
jgi:hypothetical protein